MGGTNEIERLPETGGVNVGRVLEGLGRFQGWGIVQGKTDS